MEKIKSILDSMFSERLAPKEQKKRRLIENWPKIVGKKISEHTKLSIKDNGQIVVWVDQSALAFELKQKYQEVLLKRINAEFGESAFRSIKFYVGQIR